MANRRRLLRIDEEISTLKRGQTVLHKSISEFSRARSANSYSETAFNRGPHRLYTRDRINTMESTSEDYTPVDQDQHTDLNNDAPRESIQFNQHKTPYIFFCPTLYQEDEEEMTTLVTSILRINRHRLNNRREKKDEHDNVTYEFDFDFEVNIFFDNCFVDKFYRRDKKSNIKGRSNDMAINWFDR